MNFLTSAVLNKKICLPIGQPTYPLNKFTSAEAQPSQMITVLNFTNPAIMTVNMSCWLRPHKIHTMCQEIILQAVVLNVPYRSVEYSKLFSTINPGNCERNIVDKIA